MSTSIRSPKEFSSADLDNYLAKGWRPYGQQIYTANYIQLQLGEVYSVIPTRLELSKHEWRKGQRKLLRRGKKMFQYNVQPAVLTQEKNDLNESYRNLFPTKSVEDLTIHFTHEGRQIFSTWEICIYHEEKLVAFSFFDVGQQSIYSKVGIYDPGYHKFSLGLLSMYLEVEWCMERKMKYYYPGYISPEIPLFDYKKKIGELEFWCVQERDWLELSSFEENQHSPFRIAETKIRQIFKTLQEANIKAKMYDYCFFEMPLIYPGATQYLDVPFMIILHYPNTKQCWIIRYKLDYDTFECWLSTCENKINFNAPANRERPIYEYILRLEKPYVQSHDMEIIIKGVKKILENRTQRLLSLPFE